MKLVAAQISSNPGNVEDNIIKHVAAIEQAVSLGANGIFFPELSLTGYQPTLAAELAMQPDDPRMDVFQNLSNRDNILITVGAPMRTGQGVEIAMFVFQPHTDRLTYSKQHLHPDEFPFFTPGTGQQLLSCAGHTLAPAICFESLQPIHAQQAAQAGAQLYFASVAKSPRGVTAGYEHYPQVARQHEMTVMMANCVGPADDYIGAGSSAIWNASGERVAQADEFAQALVIYDSNTGEGAVVELDAPV